ncbi:SET domain-containing protein SmydA-8-like [Cylas formicarius]|uniref:SET domain-containing protein SmydA-8-like n=1 Tax=Cylas formicarius TaxID=197179 RepID=UPI002958C2EE|nr:SET domain-containing protein SmydA-8-like [Cylas formicarius]
MTLARRSESRLNSAVRSYLKTRGVCYENQPWEIRRSDVGGYGVFVTRDVDVGEEIFRDSPVILGPRCLPNCPLICIGCWGKKELRGCKNNCGLPVCSEECQNEHRELCEIILRYCKDVNEGSISRELFENCTPIKALLLDDEDKEAVTSCLEAHGGGDHGREVDALKKLSFEFDDDQEKFMRFVCCVLDANAFEVATRDDEDDDRQTNSLRGLYPLGSLANHSCVPNTMHVFDKNHRMITRAAAFIPKNGEIFHSYTRIIWASVTRLYHLRRTKHFVCKCDRCEDPTEFGTYMGAVLCKQCGGSVIPVNPHKANSRWRCQQCKRFVTGREAGETLSMLGAVLRGMDANNFDVMTRFLNGKLKSVVPTYSQVSTELKYKIVWILGHKSPYTLQELTVELLNFKVRLCDDLLLLLARLRLGRVKMRGLLLYELFCCLRELDKRDEKIDRDANISTYLEEAADILRFDVTAPQELKRAW